MKEARRGQVMILTVLALGGAVLGATTIAGLLMLYQIRETTDLANSAKAIYAADSGIELALWNTFCASKDPSSPPPPQCPAVLPSRFGNGAKVAVTCFDGGSGAQIDCNSAGSVASVDIKSLGSSGNSNRAFGLSF